MRIITYTLLTLITINNAYASIDIGEAVFDGFAASAVHDVVKEPIKNALEPQTIYHCICTNTPFTRIDILSKKEMCYTNVVDYAVVIPPNPVATFLANLLVIVFLVLLVIWCFTSSVEEKREAIVYIICHIIGQIIYDILCGDDDD